MDTVGAHGDAIDRQYTDSKDMQDSKKKDKAGRWEDGLDGKARTQEQDGKI